MEPVKLIYFQGCPNAVPMKELLIQAGLTQIEEVDQGTLPKGHPLTGYSSPALIRGDQLLFGNEVEMGKGGCSLGLPDLEKIKALLGLS